MTPTTSGTAPAGSVENPFVDKNCLSHKPGDLDGYGIAVGPAHIPTMPNLADWYGGGLPSPNSDDVTFYKGGTEIGPTHPAVTVTIAPDARSYARLVTMYAPEPDTVSVVYVGTPKPPAGSDWACGYVGGYDLLGGRTTACVPLDIKIEGDPVVHHVVVSIGRKCPTS